MITELGNCAFVGGCDTRPINYKGKYLGQESSVEGIARMFNADMWQGQSFGEDEIKGLKKYDTVIINFNSCHLALVNELALHEKRPFIIGISEGDVQDIEICYDRKHRQLLREAIHNCNVFGSLQKTAIPFFQGIGNNKNVIWMPAPCEEEEFYITKNNHKGYRIHNQILVYVECRRSFDYTMAIINNLDYIVKVFSIGEIDDLDDTLYNVHYELQGMLPYDMFCRFLSHYRVGIRMDNRYVDGRFTKSLAGMRTLSIGTGRVEAQAVLFPELTFDPIQGVGKAREALEKVMVDEDYRNELVQEAYTKLFRIYSPERVEKTIRDQICQFV